MGHAKISSTTDNATTSSKTNGQIDNTANTALSRMDNSTISSPTNQAIILSLIDKCNYPLPWTIQQSVHQWTMQLLYLLTNFPTCSIRRYDRVTHWKRSQLTCESRVLCEVMSMTVRFISSMRMFISWIVTSHFSTCFTKMIYNNKTSSVL